MHVKHRPVFANFSALCQNQFNGLFSTVAHYVCTESDHWWNQQESGRRSFLRRLGLYCKCLATSEISEITLYCVDSFTHVPSASRQHDCVKWLWPEKKKKKERTIETEQQVSSSQHHESTWLCKITVTSNKRIIEKEEQVSSAFFLNLVTISILRNFLFFES